MAKILLLPFSIIYGIIVSIRNFLFHIGILKSKTFSIPIICVGNITVGGTGKTPHSELIISELMKHYRVACLSRGYKRKTKGFVLATEKSTAREIGDEPLQIKRKFPKAIVACDSNRIRGIEKLLALPKPPEVVILDDAFQHQYVQADKNIVLMDYNRPVYYDTLLPAGRLRENLSGLKRADYIIVTKCPRTIQPIERRLISKHLKIRPYQQLFFTTLEYGNIKGLFDNPPPKITKESEILCVTGIAQPKPYVKHLKTLTEKISEIHYPDHHNFKENDIKHIESVFEKIKSSNKYIFTTEKDAMRLMSMNLPKSLKPYLYYITVTPEFLNESDQLLNELSEYVRKNQK